MNNWPLYYKDLLKLGNSDSQVGIVTLWTICDEIVKNIDKNLYCAAGQLYTKTGINFLVRNLLANKNIRYLIISGQDRAGSGAELVKIWASGESDCLEKEIGRNSVRKMIENVRLIDMRGEQDGKKIEEEIKKINQDIGGYGKPEIFPEHKSKGLNELECHFPTDPAVFKVKGKTVADTWLKLLKTILKFGDVKKTDSMKMKEIYDMVTIVTDEDPDSFYVPEWLGFGSDKIESYLPQILGKDKITGLHYTYGYRLGNYFDIDQIEKIIDRLKNDPNAREALGVLFDPRVDIEAEHRPCIVLVQALRNQDKLHFNVYIRSNDMFGGWPLNAFGLRKLQQRISQESGILMGVLTIISCSAHIYDFNWDEARKIVEKYGKDEFEEDPRGYFKIDIDKERKAILAKHFGPEGQLLKEFEQNMLVKKPAWELSKKINEELSVSLISHAFDLGGELNKAEVALNLGIDYVQDRPLELKGL